MTTEKKKDNPKIVIDLGSSTIKCGYNCDSVPRFEIPNVIGKCRNKSMCLLRNYDHYFCGNDALFNGTSLDLKYPRIENNGKFSIDEEGITDMETLFSYILETKMKVKPDDHDFFIIDSTYTTSKERLALAKILFEKFSIYHLHFEPQAVMTLLSSAKTSGLVVESGEIATEILPVVEGYVITSGITRFPIGGNILTKQFQNEYKNIFDINNVNNHFWMSQKIKEEFSEILPNAKSFDELVSQKNDIKKEYKLPDGNSVDLGIEIYEIPESIFNPSLIGLNNKNLPETIIDSINNCDISARKPLYNNIILGGGNTLIKGFPERLKSEIEQIKAKNSSNSLNANKETCGICSYPERKYNAWIGASQISSLSSFSSNWISRVDDYSENEEFTFGQNYVFNYRGLINQKE